MRTKEITKSLEKCTTIEDLCNNIGGAKRIGQQQRQSWTSRVRLLQGLIRPQYKDSFLNIALQLIRVVHTLKQFITLFMPVNNLML